MVYAWHKKLMSTYVISGKPHTNLGIGVDGGLVSHRMSYSTILCRNYDGLAVLDDRRVSVNVRRHDWRGRLRHFRI